jgi:hypothetical protein
LRLALRPTKVPPDEDRRSGAPYADLSSGRHSNG